MYFMEALCDTAAREDHPEFIRMMERDILKIIDLVAPDDGSGAANVKVVRKVLAGLRAKAYLQPQTVMELEECIKDRDQLGGAAAGGVSPMDVDHGNSAAVKNGTPIVKATGNVRIDKRQIEQRIEEDRERHKRSRESLWKAEKDDDAEAMQIWESTADAGEDDYIIAQEESEERNSRALFHRQEMEGA